MRNDDIVLIQRILADDAIAFEYLVKKYQKQVHTLAWRKIRDFHVAEDIIPFLKVYIAFAASMKSENPVSLAIVASP